MGQEVVKVKVLKKGIELPEYYMASDVGFDLRSAETVSLMPMEQKTIKTGVAIEIPECHVGLLRDRAGIVTKMGVHTAAGTFDPAYRGEISVIMINFGDDEVEIEEGMRIAQMLIIPIKRVKIQKVDKLSETPRGEKSFGSTGFD